MGSATALSIKSIIPLNPLFQQSHLPSKFQPTRQWPNPNTTNSRISICCRNAQQDSPTDPTINQQQLNLSVLRFTLGIPGFDESYLPRWIGYAFGSLLLLNHFLGSDLSAISPAQLRTELLGLSLAGFSAVVPYLGKFLKGATPVTEKNIPEGAEQIFVMSQNISDALKEDLAWATYILLRNTNTTSVLISIQGELCIRGYWDVPKGISKDQAIECFKKQIKLLGLPNLKEALYFPLAADSEMQEMLPKGTRSVVVQPVLQGVKLSSNEKEMIQGFVLLSSTSDYAYSEKDRAWIGAVANKFRDKSTNS